jgi:putative resolvase
VSSRKQSEDLKRQINLMKKNYPNYEIITDIGSGLNLKRKGLEEIIELAIKGEIKVVVITYKDRLARFGYDLIEMILKKYSDAKIIILNKHKEETPNDEMVKDILSIMNVYVAKINGMRRNHLKKLSK